MRLATIILSSTALSAAAASVSAQELRVRLGNVASLSGGMAAYGLDHENGVRMAVEELNARGLTIGGRKARFELLSEDDASDPKQGTAAAQKLCDAKVHGVVGHVNSGTTLPAAKIYHQCGVPHITVSATNPQLTRFGYKTTFRTTPDDNALGAGVAAYAAGELKLKTVALIDDRTAYGQGVTEVFKKTALARGMQIASEHYTNDKASDFTSILTAIKAKNPDAIFFGGLYAQAGPMLRQMEQLGLVKTKFLGGDGICNPTLGELSGNARTADNVVCAEGGTAIEKVPAAAAWKKRYDARFPGQFQPLSPHTYDATMVLADAMVRAGSADPAVYLAQLAKTDYQGIMARISFAADGEMKKPPMTMYAYKDGIRVALD